MKIKCPIPIGNIGGIINGFAGTFPAPRELIRPSRVGVILFLTMAVLSSGASAAASEGRVTMEPIVLEAKSVLPAKLLQGANYTVETRVENDGLINTYRLDTDYGPTTVESTAVLMMRIAEFKAMQIMEEMESEKVFGDALVAGVKAPVEGAAKLVTEPVKTTKGVIKGTGRLLSNIGRSIVSEDPYQNNALAVGVGYDAAKRGFAYQFGINPYSDNMVVMDMLGKIARASVVGGLAPMAAMAAVGGAAGSALQLTGTSESMLKLVRDNPPGELEKINVAKLREIGISSSLIQAFMSNYIYDPQEKTLLVGELERLAGVGGRDAFIAQAAAVTEKTVALFYRMMSRMMAGYHTRISPADRIGLLDGTPYLRRKDNAAILLVPVDFVFRTDAVAAKIERINRALEKDGDASSKELWITGRVSEDAAKMLGATGWKIVEDAGGRIMND